MSSQEFQRVKVLAGMPVSLNLIPGTHAGRENRVLWAGKAAVKNAYSSFNKVQFLLDV